MASGTPLSQAPGMVHANPTNPSHTGSQGRRGKKKATTKGTQNPPNLKKSTTQVRNAGQPKQDTSSTVDSVYWERYPHLTERLLSWLISHPSDRVILFYDRRATQEGTPLQEKPSGCHKKDVHTVLAREIFSGDPVYGRTYASQPDKFATAVQSRLLTYVLSL